VGGHADPGAPAGIYKTVDTGTSWSRSDEGFRATLVDLLAIDPLDPATIYGTLETEDPQRLLKTSDGGEHWAATGLVAGVAYGKIDALALDPGNGMILYASTAAGLMRSLDGGGHWQTAGLSSPVFQIEIHPAVPGLLYAVGDAGLASTEDGGAHWRTVSVPEGVANSITIDPSDPGVLYVVTVTPERARLWSSSDRGGSWEPLPAPYSPGRLTVDPFDSSTLYLEAAGFFRSTDRGAHWVPGDATAAVFHIAADRTREGTLYARSWSPDGFRVARTLDGGMHWAPFDQGLDSAAIVTSFLIDSTGRHLYAGTAGGSAWAFDFVPGRSIISTRTSSPDRVFRPRPLPPIHGRP